MAMKVLSKAHEGAFMLANKKADVTFTSALVTIIKVLGFWNLPVYPVSFS